MILNYDYIDLMKNYDLIKTEKIKVNQ